MAMVPALHAVSPAHESTLVEPAAPFDVPPLEVTPPLPFDVEPPAPFALPPKPEVLPATPERPATLVEFPVPVVDPVPTEPPAFVKSALPPSDPPHAPNANKLAPELKAQHEARNSEETMQPVLPPPSVCVVHFVSRSLSFHSRNDAYFNDGGKLRC